VDREERMIYVANEREEAIAAERERCATLLRDAADQYRRDGWDREADAINRLLQKVLHPPTPPSASGD
jgi:uncharacterized membrane protein